MTALGRVLTEAIVLRYGADEMLRRLAHPFHALRRLDDASRRIDRAAIDVVGPSFDAIHDHERARSRSCGGRMVGDPARSMRYTERQ